jgi:hypothetical protein
VIESLYSKPWTSLAVRGQEQQPQGAPPRVLIKPIVLGPINPDCVSQYCLTIERSVPPHLMGVQFKKTIPPISSNESPYLGVTYISKGCLFDKGGEKYKKNYLKKIIKHLFIY